MQVPIVRASFRHGITTESSGDILSPSSAAGIVLGSAPARIGGIVASDPEPGVGQGRALSVTTRVVSHEDVKKVPSALLDWENGRPHSHASVTKRIAYSLPPSTAETNRPSKTGPSLVGRSATQHPGLLRPGTPEAGGPTRTVKGRTGPRAGSG